MARHTEARTGLWTLSDCPEAWPGEEFYDSRDEAIAAAGPDDTYVGEVRVMDDEEVADAFICWPEDAELSLSMGEWSWCDSGLIDFPSGDAMAELRAFTIEWVRRHKLNLRRFLVEGQKIVRGDTQGPHLH